MKKLYRLLLLISVITFTHPVYSQIQILTPNDTTICNGATANLRAVVHGRNATTLNIPIDDGYSPVIPLGFSFGFYGNYYTHCIISSNGYIRFDTTNASGFSQWNLQVSPGRIPGNQTCLNSFCGAYSDIYPVLGGTIDYATYGTAPNRMFIVNFCKVPMYSCNTQLITFQMILYEGTNICESHIGHKDTCVAWNGGFCIEGVQNLAGTAATAAPGRNDSVVWYAQNDAYRFTPIMPSFAGYSVSSIPYAPIPDAGAPLYWYQGSTYLGTGNSITVAPTTTTTYTVKAVECGDTITSSINSAVASVTIQVGGGPTVSNMSTVQPSACGACDGKIVLHGLTPGQLDTVTYTKNGVAQPYLLIPSQPDSTVTLINLCAATYDSIKIKAGVCHSSPVGPIQITDPPVIAKYTYNIHYGCNGDTVYFTNQSSTPNAALNYRWQFGDNTSDTATNPVHIFHNQGIYSVKLTAATLFCNDTVSKSINLQHPIRTSFTVSKDTICQDQSITFTNTSVGTNPTYYWTFGDGDTSTLVNPQITFPRAGTYRVKLMETDFVPCQDSAFMNVTIDSLSFLKLSTNDSALCQGQAITFTGSYLNYGYTGNTWDFGDGTVINNSNPILHAYENPGNYVVKLTTRYRVCPDSTIHKDITISPYPAVNVGPDTSMCPGANPLVITDVNNTGNASAHWQWNTGDTTSSITVTQPGVYYTTVTLNGCSTADSIWVKNDCYISIPNVFTPNNDGVNDYFFPRQLLSSSVNQFEMVIYNRWGQEIFDTKNIDGRGWDGKFNGTDQPTGVYIYIIDVSFKNGNVEHHQGNVTLMR